MKLSRRGKCFRNLLLSLLLGFLLAAWLQFPPLTVNGMCRQMGHELLITTPEPIYVVKGGAPRLANFKNTYVIARSGDSYVTFLYERPSFGVYRRSMTYWTTVSNDLTLTYYAGRLYLVGPLPEGVASARAEATVQRTCVRQNADAPAPSRNTAKRGYSRWMASWQQRAFSHSLFRTRLSPSALSMPAASRCGTPPVNGTAFCQKAVIQPAPSRCTLKFRCKSPCWTHPVPFWIRWTSPLTIPPFSSIDRQRPRFSGALSDLIKSCETGAFKKPKVCYHIPV